MPIAAVFDKRAYLGVSQLSACGEGYMPSQAVCCGAGSWCPAGTQCNGTTCVGNCPSRCGVVCTDLSYSYNDCGRCSNFCESPIGGTAYCSIGQCYKGDDCLRNQHCTPSM
ncbi:hypothetical protein M427DRAFT_456736 [Gonapodya prolifera JEL478]|uniref:Uncharacterized protein n=1 Tax=Gonapodya prolifera (strain JEL478) TaxID=1344416 RepID=A0A139A2P4_GONPJ|nr:hypothetical protein M427DRAFT_456736 [Gonapodya prolifera JEL478]|eukprot:KXS11057.1 hypothetical protein M427DRAFT_456736 [Gonapodya prolifera JEL478]